MNWQYSTWMYQSITYRYSVPARTSLRIVFEAYLCPRNAFLNHRSGKWTTHRETRKEWSKNICWSTSNELLKHKNITNTVSCKYIHVCIMQLQLQYFIIVVRNNNWLWAFMVSQMSDYSTYMYTNIKCLFFFFRGHGNESCILIGC